MNDHISHEERADTGTGDSLAMTQLMSFFRSASVARLCVVGLRG